MKYSLKCSLLCSSSVLSSVLFDVFSVFTFLATSTALFVQLLRLRLLRLFMFVVVSCPELQWSCSDAV